MNCVPEPDPSALPGFTCLILCSMMWGKCYHYSHFTSEETEVPGGCTGCQGHAGSLVAGPGRPVHLQHLHTEPLGFTAPQNPGMKLGSGVHFAYRVYQKPSHSGSHLLLLTTIWDNIGLITILQGMTTSSPEGLTEGPDLPISNLASSRDWIWVPALPSGRELVHKSGLCRGTHMLAVLGLYSGC